MEYLQRIQRWYTSHCNGDWEHSYPISITTVDNPGWSVTIPLKETCLEHASLEYSLVERTNTNWVGYSVQDGAFEGNGGPENLAEILGYFLDTFLPEHLDRECTFDLHLPVKGYEGQLWLKAEAKMLSESTMRIVSIADSKLPTSYEWNTNRELILLNQLESVLSELQTVFAIDDQVEPTVFQSEDNMLRTFLVAPLNK